MRWICSALFISLIVTIPGLSFGERVRRQNDLPNVGRNERGQRNGDAWKFYCPPGGTFRVLGDTLSNDLGMSFVDPQIFVVDEELILGRGDDERVCLWQPVCGYACPLVTGACGEGNHFVLIADYGGATTTGETCGFGGGYKFDLYVKDSTGRELFAWEVGIRLFVSDAGIDWLLPEETIPPPPPPSSPPSTSVMSKGL